MRKIPCCLATIVMALAGTTAAFGQTPLSTAFTYQGRLLDAGNAPTAQYDFNFRLFDALVGGTELLPANFRDNLQVTNGLFTTSLDFGEVMKGDKRFLQIEVRPFNSGGAFTPLTPRQELQGAPQAIGLRLPFETTRSSPAAGGALLNIENTAGARVGWFTNSDTTVANSALRADSTALFPALYGYGLSGGTNGGIFGRSDNPGDAILGQNTTATGRAGVFENTNATNTNTALYATNAGTGLAAHVDGFLQVGSTTEDGRIQLFRNGSASRVMEVVTNANGANLNLYNELGQLHSFMQADINGSGGFLLVKRSDTSNAFTVDGNNGANEPTVSITGSARSAIFAMGSSGDASVALPTSAVSSGEMLDEPGVANINTDTGVTLAGGVQVLLSRTITCPDVGYVVVIASCQANHLHVNGTTDSVDYGVSDSATAFPVTQEVAHFTPSTAPTGTYIVPATVHGMFAVAAGANTFYFLARESSGAGSVNDMSLTCMYFPTAYGTIDPPRPLPPGVPSVSDFALPHTFGLTRNDIVAEQIQAQAWDQTRIQSELTRMRAEMEQLKQMLSDNRAAAEAAAAPRKNRPVLSESTDRR